MPLTDRIRAQAAALGFDLVGVSPAAPVPTFDRYREWLARGYHGDMAYLSRVDRVARRGDPTRILPGVCSVVSVGLNYYPGSLPPEVADDPARGRFSRYAWGGDYHDLILPRLKRLAEFIIAESGGEGEYRAYVDTGPVLERAYAAQAGLGFIGKSTNLINPRFGPWLFLGEILLTVELEPTPPPPLPSCGNCRRCLDACPTGALTAPYLLDARRCLSYLTIEARGAIPIELRPRLGNRVYGCDVCLEVCPWSRFARPTDEDALRPSSPEEAAPPLVELMRLDEAAFRQRYRGTPIYRLKRRGLLRNVAVALGNWGDPAAIPALTAALHDPEPLIREHAAWALAQIGAGRR